MQVAPSLSRIILVIITVSYISITHVGFPISFKCVLDFDSLSNPDQLVELGAAVSVCSSRHREVRGNVRESSWPHAVSAYSSSNQRMWS